MKLSAKKIQLIISVIFLAALVYIIITLKLDLVYSSLRGSNKFLISLGFLSLFFSALVKILRFKGASSYYDHKVPIIEASLIQMVGISLAMFTPGRIGEGSKALLLNKRHKIPITHSFGIVIFERFFDLFFLSTGAFIFSYYILNRRITILIGLFIVALFLLFIFFIKYSNSARGLIPEKYRGYFTDIELKHDPRMFITIFLLTITAWTLQAGLPWLIALSLGIKIHFLVVVGIVSLGVIAILFSVMPLGLGATELSYLFLYSSVGVTRETAFTIILIHRVIDTLIPVIMALFLLNYHNLSLKDIRDIKKSDKRRE